MLQLPLERDLVNLSEADLELAGEAVRLRSIDLDLRDGRPPSPASVDVEPPLVISGRIVPEQGSIVTVVEGADARPLLQLTYHSPTGFAWGYAGSGPADLALSILHLVLVKAFHLHGRRPVGEHASPAMALVDRYALTDHAAGLAQALAFHLHQDYKFAVVTALPDEPWSITERNVLGFLLEHLVVAG